MMSTVQLLPPHLPHLSTRPAAQQAPQLSSTAPSSQQAPCTSSTPLAQHLSDFVMTPAQLSGTSQNCPCQPASHWQPFMVQLPWPAQSCAANAVSATKPGLQIADCESCKQVTDFAGGADLQRDSSTGDVLVPWLLTQWTDLLAWPKLASPPQVLQADTWYSSSGALQ